MITKELNQLRREDKFEQFYDKILDFIPSLKDFVAHKLKISENLGEIDKNFYRPNSILNEVFLDVYKDLNKDIDEKDLRKKLFDKSVEKIEEKTKIERQFSNHINIDKILKEELKIMDERFTVDGDGDFILYDELDDISYRQDDFKTTHFILDESIEKLVTEKLNLEDRTLQSAKKRHLLGGLFYKMPPRSKYIVELFVFANQSIDDIAEMLQIQNEMVTEVINRIKEKFKLIL